MNDNTVFALNVILRVLGGVAIVFGGIYLILNNHVVGGGWTILGGIIIADISFNSDDSE